MKLKQWISENTTNGLVVDICSASQNENLAAFHTSGFDEVLDTTIVSRHGKQTVDSDYVEDADEGTDAVEAYLMERNRYLAQVLAYFAAEYNPIENYSQSEHEEITKSYDELNQHGTNTKAQDTFQHGAHTDTISIPQYSDYNKYPEYTDTVTTGANGGYNVTTHIAKQKVTTHPGDVTDTKKVAPFESSAFHNKEQNLRETGEGWESTERVITGDDAGNDKVTYSTRTDNNKHGLHNDEIQHGAHDDEYQYQQYNDIAHVGDTEDSFTNITDEREDGIERSLTRSGNIGVQTSAQMMSIDESYWWNFKPMQKLAREIAALLVDGVTCC